MKNVIFGGEYYSFGKNPAGVMNVLISGVPVPVPGLSGVNIVSGSSGWHHEGFVDSNGGLWLMSDGSNESAGMSMLTPTAKQFMTSGVKQVVAYDQTTLGCGVLILKTDGTVWYIGSGQGGFAGDGTTGKSVTSFVQITGLSNIIKISAGNIFAMALDSSGQVWTWGGNGTTNVQYMLGQPSALKPGKVVLPETIIDIVGGNQWGLAVTVGGNLYGWSNLQQHLGINSTSTFTPGLLNKLMGLPLPVASIAANSLVSYAILWDGSLWSWGNNVFGCCGNGVELPMAAQKYFIWPSEMDLFQAPVQVGIGKQWAAVSANGCFCYTAFAEDSTGQLYSWGRNKGGVLANSIVAADGVIGTLGANYANSWDVTLVTPINPFSATAPIPMTSPICLTTPTAAGCSGAKLPASRATTVTITAPSIAAGATTATLSPVATGNLIVYWRWEQVGGAPLVYFNAAKNLVLSGLQPGTYAFSLTAIDQFWTPYTPLTVTLVVPAVVVTPPPPPPPPPPGPRTVANLSLLIGGVLTPVSLTGAKITYSDGTVQ